MLTDDFEKMNDEPFEDDLVAAKGLLTGTAISLLFWVIVYWLVR